jgi:hypothetical protein
VPDGSASGAVVPGSWTAADWTTLGSAEVAAAEAVSELAGWEGAGVVTTGSVVVGGAVVGSAVVAVAAPSGADTRRVRHSPWLPAASNAQICTETPADRCGQETVALVSVVWTEPKPSPLTTYSFTATLSWLASHASEMVVSLLARRRRFVTADGGRVSGAAVVAGGADHTGIFAVEGFDVGAAGKVREIPACST